MLNETPTDRGIPDGAPPQKKPRARRWGKHPTGRCQAPGCDRPHRMHGWCQMHAKRMARTGRLAGPALVVSPRADKLRRALKSWTQAAQLLGPGAAVPGALLVSSPAGSATYRGASLVAYLGPAGCLPDPARGARKPAQPPRLWSLDLGPCASVRVPSRRLDSWAWRGLLELCRSEVAEDRDRSVRRLWRVLPRPQLPGAGKPAKFAEAVVPMRGPRMAPRKKGQP